MSDKCKITNLPHVEQAISARAATRTLDESESLIEANRVHATPATFAASQSELREQRFAFVASNDSIDSMATLTIRQLDEKTKRRLRVRAAHHGRSMEEEAREILRTALIAFSPAKGNLAEAIRQRFAPFNGFEFELPRRDAMRQAADFAE
jgi:plasmid stability protein